MRNLSVENKESICEIIWNAIINFFKSMFTSRNTSCFGLSSITKKFVIKSHCKDSCCCRNCSCIAAYDEKEEDDSDDDIIISDEDVKLS